MSRLRQIVMATNNAAKLKEISMLLAGLDTSIVPQADFGIGDAEESGESFVENAIIKARHAASLSNLPAIADDSGLEVDVLQGEPGIHSARYAGTGASDADNLRLLLRELEQIEVTRLTARFQCVMVYLRHAHDPTPLIAQGTWQGQIVTEPRGNNGFGYDPVFYVPGCGCTAAELSAGKKNSISHRGQALQLLLEKLSVILQQNE